MQLMPIRVDLRKAALVQLLWYLCGEITSLMPQMLVDEAPALRDAKCCTEMQGCSHRDSRVPASCLGAGRWNTAIRDLQE